MITARPAVGSKEFLRPLRRIAACGIVHEPCHPECQLCEDVLDTYAEATVMERMKAVQ